MIYIIVSAVVGAFLAVIQFIFEKRKYSVFLKEVERNEKAFNRLMKKIKQLP